MDEELRGLAFTTLQALMVDFPEWREDVLSGFVYFIVREVTDVHPTLLDNAVKMLLQLISQWRQAVQSSNKSHDVQVGLRQTHMVKSSGCWKNYSRKAVHSNYYSVFQVALRFGNQVLYKKYSTSSMTGCTFHRMSHKMSL